MIRYVNYVLALFLVALIPSFVLSQEDSLQDITPPQAIGIDVPTGAFAAIPDGATVSAKVFREEVAKGIVQAAENDPTVTRVEKLRIKNIMRGGWLVENRKQTIITNVIQGLHAQGAIAVTPEGVQAAIDWDQVFAIIEKMIPIVKMFIALFGG